MTDTEILLDMAKEIQKLADARRGSNRQSLQYAAYVVKKTARSVTT